MIVHRVTFKDINLYKPKPVLRQPQGDL